MVTQVQTDVNNYIRKLARSKSKAKMKLNIAWTKYRSAKQAFWDSIRDPNYLSGRGKGNVALLVISLLAVYFLDFLFGRNVADFMAKQAFHGSDMPWAISAATFIFPLAYITIEIMINFQTHEAKMAADYFDHDRGKHWTWLAWLFASLLLAMAMPILYIATGLAGKAVSGNIFAWLLGGFTLLAFLVHVMLIFSGSTMLAAKQRLVMIVGCHCQRDHMQKSYYRLMECLGTLKSLEFDYQTVCDDIGRTVVLETPAPLVIYVDVYITQDYHHLPFGEEPPLFAHYGSNAGLLGSDSN
jgi:hypothetical protein